MDMQGLIQVPVIAVTMLALALSGCSESPSVFRDSCNPRIRYEGEVYTFVGFSNRPVTPAGAADIVQCANDAKDSTVDAVSFDGYRKGKVIGVLQNGATYTVFVVEGVDRSYVLHLHKAGLTNAGEQ